MRELLRAGRREVREVLLSAGNDASPLLDEIATLARSAGVRVRLVDAAELDARAVTESPQGVLARAAPLRPVALDALLEPSPVPFLVVLDGVTDPRNLGSILRTAVSAGATGAVLPAHRSARVSPSAAKAAAGAVEYLPIALAPGIPAALEQLRRAEVWSVGLDANGEREIEALELASEPLALVLGAEGRGLAPLVRRRCDVLARITLHGAIDSLNVSAAAAVACFAVAGRRRG